MSDNAKNQVEQWFDPMDPWSWVVFRWLLEVEQVRDVDLRLHVMSVAVVNADREVPEQYRDDPQAYLERMRRSLGPVRVCTAAVRLAGEQVLRDLYTAMGSRIHEQDNKDFDDVIAGSLDEAGLPAELAEAARTADHDERIKSSTSTGMDAVGLEIGTPILRINGHAFFGPVISKIARGERAGRLFDALAVLGDYPHLSELKRARIGEPEFD